MQDTHDLEPIMRALAQARTADISLATGETGQHEFHELTVTDVIGEHFFSIAEQLAHGRLQQTLLRPFDPGYRAQDHELSWISLNDDRFEDLRADADQAFRVDQHEQWDEEDWNIDLYSVCLSRPDAPDIVMWRNFESKHQLTQRPGTKLFWSGRRDAIDNDLLVIDNTVDALLYQNRLYLLREYTCRYMLDLAQCMIDDVRQAVTGLTNQIPVSNLNGFIEACAGQPPMLSKLSSVLQRDYLEDITIEDVEAVAHDNEVDVDFTTEDGSRKVVFDRSPSRRWAILKLLDDDYLTSQMTERNYEANSKRPS